MNFLAHFYLSGENETVLLGNFLGDFVKGNPFKKYPKALATAIQLHREIDVFTDTHEAARESTRLIRPLCGKFAGVVTDMFYDHLLAKHWQQFHSQPLVVFSQHVYKTLQKYHQSLPLNAQRTLYYMKTHNWLVSYAEYDGLQTALQNLERRIRHKAPLGKATELLQAKSTLFEANFFRFFPEVKQFVAQKLQQGE